MMVSLYVVMVYGTGAINLSGGFDLPMASLQRLVVLARCLRRYA